MGGKISNEKFLNRCFKPNSKPDFIFFFLIKITGGFDNVICGF